VREDYGWMPASEQGRKDSDQSLPNKAAVGGAQKNQEGKFIRAITFQKS
jgi:hypothetical protein